MRQQPFPGEDSDALLEALAALFLEPSPEAALTDGSRLVAQVAGAPVAAVFLVRGGGIAAEFWHADDPSHRTRFEGAFREMALARAGSGARAASHEPVLVSAPAGGPDLVVLGCVAWPDQDPVRLTDHGVRLDALVGLLAARSGLHERDTQLEEQRDGYERWFRTLDQQLRLLDRERQKFSAVVSQSDLLMFVADTSGTIRWTNKAMTELAWVDQQRVDWLGRTCGELCGRLKKGVAASKCARCPLAGALETNQASHHELRANGVGASRTFYMTALPIRGPDGLPHEVMVMLQDLTDLAVLRKSESRYRLLFERSANAIIMIEPRTQRLVLANPMTNRMLGYGPGELERFPLSGLFVNAGWPEVEALCSSVTAAGPLEGFECHLRTKDGGERVAAVSPSRFDLNGEEVLLLEFLDVTERKHAEETLREREQQLRQSQKIEAVGRLAGGIAHGFNNLLAVIMGRIGLMRDRLPSDHPLRRDAEQIHNACVQGSWLTRQLLTFSRKEVASPRVLDLRDVVSQMDGMLRCVLSEKIELVSAPGSTPAWVEVDEAHVEQVLLNLVINARDAMRGDGIITIELSHVERDEKTPDDHGLFGPYVLLTVRDDGIGMDEETRAHLFEPFFTTKERGKGSGLGLSIVYGIVTQAGGHIQVSSERGLGTTVRIYLPRATMKPNVGRDATSWSAPTAGGETVLVVEDDGPVRAVTCEALALDGYNVLSAASGHQALEIVEQHRGPLHLLVTDVVMPGMSGGELAERLALIRPETQVIFVSGYVDDAVVRDGVIAAGAHFLQKPFPLEALSVKARDVLDSRSPDSGRAPDAAHR